MKQLAAFVGILLALIALSGLAIIYPAVFLGIVFAFVFFVALLGLWSIAGEIVGR